MFPPSVIIKQKQPLISQSATITPKLLPGMLRHRNEVEKCIFLGKALTLEEGRQYDDELVALGVKMNTCNRQRKELHCSQHKFTNPINCMKCPTWRDSHEGFGLPDEVKRAMSGGTNSRDFTGSMHHEKPSLPVGFSRQPIRFDHTNLAPETGGVRLNCSIAPFKDGYAFAYRNRWGAANISVIRLTKDFLPINTPVQLKLKHATKWHGYEDPRLFWHKDKLHAWFIGWAGGRSRAKHKASVGFARLSDSFDVEDVFFPDIPNRPGWVKNTSYFDHEGETYSVFSIAPHRVDKVFCESVTASYETPTDVDWKYGHLRGGASPVRVGDEYYHFYHGMREENGGRLYSTGCAVFEAKPPFRIKRITPNPIDIADPLTNPGSNCHVVFVGGAVLVDGVWILACGVHDKWSELRFFDAAEIEKQMVTV